MVGFFFVIKGEEMKSIKIKKIISICLLLIMIISTINTVVMAMVSPNQIRGDRADAKVMTDQTIDKAGKNFITILQAIGVVLSVVILIVVGIKYMLGSAEEKSEYKKTLVPYIIGAALIFAAAIFAQVIYDFFYGWGTQTPSGGPTSTPEPK